MWGEALWAISMPNGMSHKQKIVGDIKGGGLGGQKLNFASYTN
jgi:hypothetical protein